MFKGSGKIIFRGRNKYVLRLSSAGSRKRQNWDLEMSNKICAYRAKNEEILQNTGSAF